MSPAYPITLSPHLRYSRAGCKLKVNAGADGRFKLALRRGEEVVARATAARSGNITVAEAERRAVLNLWGPTSEFYQAQVAFAELAEALASNKNV